MNDLRINIRIRLTQAKVDRLALELQTEMEALANLKFIKAINDITL